MICLMIERSPEKKNKGNFASCATRNDAVSRPFFGVILRQPKNKNKEREKVNSFLNSLILLIIQVTVSEAWS
jgi:hypothetical protein